MAGLLWMISQKIGHVGILGQPELAQISKS